MNRTRLRWCHWASFGCSDRWIAVAVVVVAATVVAVWNGHILRPWAGPGFTPVLPLSLVFAAGAGMRMLGTAPRDLRAWRSVYAVLGLLFGAVFAWFVITVGPSTEGVAFLVGALEEEIVFRLALPLASGGAVAIILGRPGSNPAQWGRAPVAVALVIAGVAFVVMPGHLSQMDNALAAIPFAATALLFTYIVLRTGALLPGVLAHATLNLATVCFLSEALPRTAWSLVVIAVLATYALGAEHAGRRLGYLVSADRAATPALARA